MGDAKSNQSSGKERTIRRVGLVSPCSGNLGNAAIMSSMIEHLRLRAPGVEIVGITLSPEDTSHRHGITGFPITGTTHGSYYYMVAVSVAAGARPKAAGALRIVKETLKRVPLLRRIVKATKIVRMESNHIVRAARLVRTLDRVIVTGGGALDDYWGGPWGHPWTLFKFAILSRLFHVPFLFVSVGMCTLKHPLSRWFVSGALRLAEYRSYRDCESETMVRAMFPGFSGIVWPDLAFAYWCPDLPMPRKDPSPDGRLRLAVSPIAFCDPRVWPVKDITCYSRYYNQIVRFVRWAIKNGHSVILFATDGGDEHIIKDLAEVFSEESITPDRIQVLPCPPKQTTEDLLQSISGADVVIASRLHAVILSHLIAKPVVAISYDRKVDVHMSEIGQSEYCMNIDEFTSETLVERFAALEGAREFETARLREAVRLNREQVEAQFDLLFGPRTGESWTGQHADQLLTKVRR